MEDSAAERIELRQAADEVLRLREVEVQLTSQLDEQRKVSLDVSARLDEIESKIPENEALVEQWKQENYNARLKVKHLELALDQERAFQAQAAEQRGAVAEQNARLGAEVDALRSLVMQERTERDKKIRQGLADAATEIAEKDREVTELTRLSLEVSTCPCKKSVLLFLSRNLFAPCACSLADIACRTGGRAAAVR